MRANNFQDISGQQFGYFLVTDEYKYDESKERGFWKCICVCGTVKYVEAYRLKTQKPSCGCIRSSLASKGLTTHGLSSAPIYKAWSEMKRRCYNPEDMKYHRYGGRGIRVCESWLTFENFYRDMGERPDGHTLDRIDNDGDYTPENCRWANSLTQSINKSNTKMVTANVNNIPVTKPLLIWSKETGLKYHTIARRLAQGWTSEEALFSPLIPNQTSDKTSFRRR